MLTFKQLEAIYWIAKLGTFGAAAEKLHTSQSAISKRVSELEEFLGTPLFDRSRRQPQLTSKGKELLEEGEELLQQRDRLLARMGKTSAVVRRFRLGVTELAALTWLPRLVQEVRVVHPSVSLEPEIDVSMNLFDRLAQGDIDLIIVPSVFQDPRFVAVPVSSLRLAWMCSPDLIPDGRLLSVRDLAAFPILMQVGRSVVDAVYEQWFRAQRIKIRRIFAGNSLIALSALTMSGFGVAYLPELYFADLVEQGLLKLIDVDTSPPEVPYFAVYRGDGPVVFGAELAELCQRFCDFSKPPVGAASAKGSGATPPRAANS